MKNNTEKSDLTVKVEPLKKKGLFDIYGSGKKAGEQEEKMERRWWRFLTLGMLTLLPVMILAVHANSKNLIDENKEVVKEGYERLNQAAKWLSLKEFERADRWFDGAEDAFAELEQNTQFLENQSKGYQSSGLYLDAADKLIKSAVQASRLGQDLSVLLEAFRRLPADWIRQNTAGSKKSLITHDLRKMKEKIDIIRLEAVKLHQHLTGVNPRLLPEDFAAGIQKAQIHLNQLLALLNQMHLHFDAFLTLLGDNVPHRYLVLFQNTRERRATGGFIGSYALIDVNDGIITKMDVRDVYQTDGQLLEKVKSPPGIEEVADQWYMRDANYSPDFPTSAEKIRWFLEKSQGPSVDTVIAIDQTVAEALLEVAGPLPLPGFHDINSSDWTDFLSFYTESKLSNTRTPKQMLIDSIPLFKEKVLNIEYLPVLAKKIQELAKAGHIQAYSAYPPIQKLAADLKIDGTMIQVDSKTDYLSLITTSIGGNKSDAFIQTQLHHHTQVGDNGHLIDQLTVQKEHTWSEADFESWKRWRKQYPSSRVDEGTLRLIHGAGDNVDYLRIYVPPGSRLLNAEGIDLSEINRYEDLGYTVFAFQMRVFAGQKKQIRLTYELPFKMKKEDIYKFIAQMQAGAENIALKKSLETGEKHRVVQNYPAVSPAAFDLYPHYETIFNQHQVFLSAISRPLSD